MITTLQQSKLHSGFNRAGIWKVLCFLILNLGLTSSLLAQTVITIPNPYEDTAPELNGGTIENTRQPLTNYEKFERSAAIYTSSEIGTSGTITAIAYEIKSVNNPQQIQLKIYLEAIPTSTTSFSSGATVTGEIAGATLVFDGLVSPTTTGWFTINLTTPFVYDATTSNLEVITENSNPCTSCTFGADDPNSDAKLSTFNDNLTNAFLYENESPAGGFPLFRAITSFRPNIQLTITGGVTPTCATPTDLAVSSITSSSGTLTFTDNTSTEPGSYVVKIGAPGFDFTNSGTIVSGPPYTASGLTPNTTYEFAVQKNCTNGASGTIEREQFTTSSAPVVCDAPTSVSGTGTGQTTAQITFSGGTASGAYIIEYGPTSTFPSGTTTANVSGSPANLTGLTPGTAYTFVVRTDCGSGNISNNSPQGTFTTSVTPVACDAPTSVSGTGTGQTTAQITFSGGTASGAYIIEYGPTSTFPSGTTTANVSGSPANLTGLTPGTAYTFVVRTDCGSGNISNNSPQGTFTTSVTPVACDAPTSVSGTGTGQTTAQITFSGGTASGAYIIEYGPTSTFPSGTTTANVSGSPANLTGLTPGTAYTFVVRTDCGSGNISNNSPQGTFTTSVTPVACDAPTSVSGTGTGQTTAQITFSGGTASGAYIIEYGPTSTFPSGTTTANVSGSPANLTGLTPGTAYTFVVRTDCGNGNISNNSPQGTFTTTAAPVACDAPTSVSGTGTGQTTAQITFSGGTASGAYIIEYGPTSTFPSGTTTANVSGSPANLTGLTPGTAYTFVVRTDCGNGNISNNSPQGTFTTTAAPVACDAPTSVSGTGTGQTTAQITFSGGTASGAYIIEYGPTSTFPSGTTTANVSGSPANLTGLTPGTAYTFVVRTDCGSGNISNNSPQGTFTTSVTPPVCVTGTWLGTTSSDWHTAANWCNGVIPDVNTNVIIPANAPNFPVITATAISNNLLIEAGATLTLASGVLTINGTYTNFGTLIDNGNGSLVFNSVLPQTLGKSGQTITFLDLTTGPGGVVLAGPIGVRRVLTLNGNLTTLGNDLTLLADNAVQAMVVNNGAAQVVGTATFEKYINPGINPSFGYRHLSSPVSNATLNQLNDDTPLIVNPAYNVDPATAIPFPTVFRYNETRVTPANPIFDAGWESPSSLGETMAPGVGYTINMLPVEVDITGELNNGNITRPITRANPSVLKSGWNFLGNPYPSPIDWSLVNKNNVLDNAAYVFRSSGQYSGSYISYVNGIPAGGQYIAAMQGFFVRATSSGSVTFENNDRVTTYENPALYRQVETRPLIELTLKDNAGKEDKTYVYFQNGATANFDSHFDAYKLPNSGAVPTIYSTAGIEQLSINGLPVSTSTTIIPLGGRVPQSGTWTIQADQIINFLPNQTIYLEDMVTNTMHNLSQQNTYTFSTTQTSLTGRFYLRFGPGATTGISKADLAAKVLVYPNPNKGEFTLSMPTFNSPVLEATLFNAIGQKVWTKTLQPDGAYLKEKITTHNLPTGVYTLQLETSAGPVQRKIVIE